jgi:hypothetical protein
MAEVTGGPANNTAWQGRRPMSSFGRPQMAFVRDSVHDNWVYAQAVDHERCC